MDEKKNEAAVQLGRLGGIKGGRARANKLSNEQRTDIARGAAEARWGSRSILKPTHLGTLGSIPKATHAGTLQIGEIAIPCFVLENGKRVISQSGMSSTLGTTKGGTRKVPGDRLANFLAANAIRPFVPPALATIPNIKFRLPKQAFVGNGYEATILVEICKIVLEARRAGVLNVLQARIADRCETLLAAFGNVGIIALVDEATGYQSERDRDELHKLLEKYISKELLPWTKRFPDEFYRQIYRLMGWEYPRGANHPWLVGRYTKAIVYKRLPPGVLEQLERKNPYDEKGARRFRHHQWLSEDFGNPALRDHLIKVVTAMQCSDSWEEFTRKLPRIAPGPGDHHQMELFRETKSADPDLDPPGNV